MLGGSVDVVPTRFFAGADGIQSVDLNGADSGAVFQIITNTPGVQYRLSFAFAGNPCSWCGAPIKEMEVTWGSSVVATVSQDVTGRTTTEMGWRRFSFVVTGTGRDRLAFRSLTAGLAGPALDEVSVVPNDTPEVFTGLDIRKAVQLSFPTVVGKTYQIESADKADSTVWNLLSSPIPGTGSLITFTDSREDPIKIYRVIEK